MRLFIETSLTSIIIFVCFVYLLLLPIKACFYAFECSDFVRFAECIRNKNQLSTLALARENVEFNEKSCHLLRSDKS